MNPAKYTCIGLCALFCTAGQAWAELDSAISLHQGFDLRVKASLSRTVAPTPLPIVFIGPGKAKATPQGVTLKFDVLTPNGQRGKAVIRWRNPLEYHPDRPHFAGRGVARVRLPHANFRFRLGVKGTIIRCDDGELLIHGRFSSAACSVDGAKLVGKFVGKEH